jgi:hypothetical protein
MHNLFIHARHETFYTVSVRCFLLLNFSEKIVPHSKFHFRLFKVELYNFYLSQASIRKPPNGYFQEKLIDTSYCLRCLFYKAFAGCFAFLRNDNFGT